jgi:MSHA biogenesis protein MshN
MSLINKMLQDLDARGNKAGAALGQQELRPVGMPRRQARPVLLGAAAVGAVALAAGGWYGWQHFHAKAAPPRPAPVMVVVPAAPAPAVTLAPVVAAAPVSESVAVPASAPVPAAARIAGGKAVPASTAAGSAEVPQAMASAEEGGSRPAPHAHEHAREAVERTKAERASGAVAGSRGKTTESHARPLDKDAGGQAAGGVMRELGPAQLAENRYRRALLALQEGRTSEAVVELQRAVEIEPRHEAARQTLVTLLIENRRPDEAAQQLQQALALDYRQPGMAMLLARLQLENGGPALETLMRTLPYAGDNAEYQGFLAGVLQRAQRHGEAVEHYQAALKLLPQKGVWWMGLAISLQAEKRLPEARAAYTRARAANGMTPELQAFVDRKLEALGR